MRCLGRMAVSGYHDDTVGDIVDTMAIADALFMRCELVVHAQQSLTSLNSAIDEFIHDALTASR